MDSETLSFGVPFAGLLLGGIVLVWGLFPSGLSLVPVLGGTLGLLSITTLAFALARAVSDEPSVTLAERDREGRRYARQAK